MASILAICQLAAREMSMTPPSSLTNGGFGAELLAFANETASDLVDGYDWRVLTFRTTVVGTGAATSFTFPQDYDRLPEDPKIYKVGTQLPMNHVDELDTWLDYELRQLNLVNGRWIILGGRLNISPTLAATESASYYYIGNWYASNGGTPKAQFDADADVSILPDRLIKLGTIWRWRASKGLDYAEQMRTSEMANERAYAQQKGQKIIAVGRARVASGMAEIAFPGVIDG